MELIATVGQNPQTTGAIVFWRLSGRVSVKDLKETWEEAGLPKEYLPEAPTKLATLKRVLDEMFVNANTLVRPLPKESGYAVLYKELDANNRPLFRTVYTVLMVDGVEIPVPVGMDDNQADKVLHAFEDGMFYHSADEIGSGWLSRKIIPMVQATRLRDTGGIYFVPAPFVELWETIRSVVQGVSKHLLEIIPAMNSEAAIDAILRSIEAEASELATELENDIAEFSMDPKATRPSTLQRRKAKALAMEQKLSLYEGVLGKRLEGMHAKLQGLQAGLAGVVLLQNAAEMDDL